MKVKYFEQLFANLAARFKTSILTLAGAISHLPVKSYTFLKQHYVLAAGLALLIIVPLIIRSAIWYLPVATTISSKTNDNDLVLAQQTITREISILDKKLNAKKPSSYYLVINSASNEFALYKGSELIKKDICSTGSYKLLKNGDGQQWMFKTPKGEFRIRGKVTSPVWRKPDWAFVEEGLPVPSLNHHSRYESGVLGDYALSLGDGYLIHGTLYQRFLGLPVTHGCIRLNDENLELVYKSLPVGSKVYIY
jgi:L,D-transpeptidase YbiS